MMMMIMTMTSSKQESTKSEEKTMKEEAQENDQQTPSQARTTNTTNTTRHPPPTTQRWETVFLLYLVRSWTVSVSQEMVKGWEQWWVVWKVAAALGSGKCGTVPWWGAAVWAPAPWGGGAGWVLHSNYMCSPNKNNEGCCSIL